MRNIFFIGSWFCMLFSFCKKSVFSILFLLFIFLGTICGVLLFRCIFVARPGWISDYCVSLGISSFTASVQQFVVLSVPFFLVWIAGMTAYAHRAILVIILLRGCLLSYYLCALYSADAAVFPHIIRSFPALLFFFIICQAVWVRSWPVVD